VSCASLPLRLEECPSPTTHDSGGHSMSFLIRMVVNAVAILLIGYLLPQVVAVDGVAAALATAFVLGVVNAFVRPLFVLLTLPITVVTLGVFLLVINGLLLGLVAYIVPGFHVNGFLGAVVGSILLSVVSWILTKVVE
jgi:putative membrane protein